MRDVHYDSERFRELVVYIAEQVGDDPSFGDIKLNKTLYWADFYAYNHLGRPITGARYKKERLGPIATPLVPARRELEAEAAVRVEQHEIGTKTANVTVALRPARRDLFTRDELLLVDEIIRLLKPHSGMKVSDLSHRVSVGWNLVEMHEEIPYSTALISTDPPSEATVERGRELAARFGW